MGNELSNICCGGQEPKPRDTQDYKARLSAQNPGTITAPVKVTFSDHVSDSESEDDEILNNSQADSPQKEKYKFEYQKEDTQGIHITD